jgi:hypothetical protein
MPVTQQQALFTSEEAGRFAALWAGFDTGNASEAEAMGKGRALRRMVAAKGVRLADAYELPEIRAALDAQMQPVRQAMPDVAALQEELTARMADVRKLATDLAGCEELLLRRERECEALRRRLNSAGAAAPSGWSSDASLMGDTWLAQVLFMAVGLVALVAALVLNVAHFIGHCIDWLFH